MPWLTTRRLLIAALAAWIAVAAIGLVIGPPLGHDEAAFAVAARGDLPAGAWLYRSDGTIAIAWLGVALGGGDWELRLASAVLGAAIVVAAFAVGRAAFSPRTGAWAAALVAGAHPMALRSAQLLSDLPAAAAALGGIAILVGELGPAGRRDAGRDRDAGPGRDAGPDSGRDAGPDSGRGAGPRWRIVAAAPLFAAAFYLRYASAPVIALAIAAAGLVWWRAIAARPLPALAMLGALAALLVPHLVRSFEATGSVLGILEVSAGLPRRTYVGEGVVTYVASNPLVFYGALIGPVMAAGLLGLARVRRRAPWYLAIVAIGQIVVLGLDTHGQARYVFVATVLLVVLGVDTVTRFARFARPRLAAAAVTTAWLGVLVAQVITCRRAVPIRAPIMAAARAIRADAAGRPCAAVAALAPQLVWYARCPVYPSALGAALPTDRIRYAASFTEWPIDLDRTLATQHLRAVPIATGDPDARVWRLE